MSEMVKKRKIEEERNGKEYKMKMKERVINRKIKNGKNWK